MQRRRSMDNAGEVRMLPNFLIIGARKAGTTSLWNYVRAHPQVFMSKQKELKFFVLKRNWSQGLAWYEQQFEGAEDAVAVGECSPGYTSHPHAQGIPERISEILPDVRLIYVVRHPVERMRSHYLMNVWHLWESESSIDRALLTNPRYLDESRYAMQIEQYLPYFSAERLLVIKSEDLRDARSTTLRRVYAFLGVETSWVPENLVAEFNTTRSKEIRIVRPTAKLASRMFKALPGRRTILSLAPTSVVNVKRRVSTRGVDGAVQISDDVRFELEGRLRPEVQRLRAYIGQGFDGWGIG
jgi:hypothetical protein